MQLLLKVVDVLEVLLSECGPSSIPALEDIDSNESIEEVDGIFNDLWWWLDMFMYNLKKKMRRRRPRLALRLCGGYTACKDDSLLHGSTAVELI